MTWCWMPSITRQTFCSHWVQVYPEGNQSNNNQFMAAATGTISAIDGLKVPKSLRLMFGDDLWQIIGISVTSDIFSAVGLGLVSPKNEIPSLTWDHMCSTKVLSNPSKKIIQPKNYIIAWPIKLEDHLFAPSLQKSFVLGQDRPRQALQGRSSLNCGIPQFLPVIFLLLGCVVADTSFPIVEPWNPTLMGKMVVHLGWGPLNNQPHIHLISIPF